MSDHHYADLPLPQHGDTNNRKHGRDRIAAYAYYYATRFYLLFRNGGHKFNLFMLAVRIGFEGYSMMDTGTFVPFPNMMLVIILTFILEINPSDKRFEGVADEYNSLFPKRNKLAKNAK